MFRRIGAISFGAFLVLSMWTAAPAQAANPCNPCAANPCAAKNPCAANPCAAKNPCAGANPCNPCGGGGASAKWEGVMVTGQVVGFKGGYLSVRSDGKVVRLHVTNATLAHVGGRSIRPASLKRGQAVHVSTQARGSYYKANFIYALAGGGGNPCAANPCAAKNPCAANPCAANPCAAKNPCAANPCAAKNPCAGR